SFHCIEQPEVKKAINMLRPGYTPPSKFTLAGRLLNEVFQEEKIKCSEKLSGEFVCRSIDGWSNIHNESVVCATVTVDGGTVYLYDNIDISGHPHASEYLTALASDTIKSCEQEFKHHVTSFLTDDAANMAKMRKALEEIENIK
uniref:Uncharacterized protein n=1 Tax=Latimeria chalumnae TaxID=7897 RepID=H3AJX7_LATCH